MSYSSSTVCNATTQLVHQYRQSFLDLGLPESLHVKAIEKLLHESFDIGSKVEFHERDTDTSSEDEDEEEEGKEANLNDNVLLQKELEDIISDKLPRAYDVVASDSIKSLSDVFLIDHMWTSTFPQMRDQLCEMPSLVKRIATLLGFDDDNDEENEEEDDDDDDDDDEDAPKSTEENPHNQKYIDKIWSKLWPYMNSYIISEHEYSQWYLMDEVGTSVRHSTTPNCRCVAFMFQPPQPQPQSSTSTYLPKLSPRPPLIVSLLWPIKDISPGEILTRDYLPSVPLGHVSRPLRLLGYVYPLLSASEINRRFKSLIMSSFESTSETTVTTTTNSNTNTNTTNTTNTTALAETSSLVPTVFNSTSSTTTTSTASAANVDWTEALTNLNSFKSSTQSSKVLKVFCDRSDHLCKDFTHNTDRIQIVATPQEADVLYLIDHTVNTPSVVNMNQGTAVAPATTGTSSSSNKYQQQNNGIYEDEYIKKGKMINQFWWNGMLVSKEHFARTVKSAAKTTHVPCPNWLPVTYDLSKTSDLSEFVSDFIQSEYQSEDEIDSLNRNIWILKRYRGKQSVDYPITSNLSCALRHLDTAPRLACRYIQTPLLHEGRKFDLRYYVLVHSLEPLVLFRHPLFIVRRANVVYSLNNLENYQQQFTVMSLLDDPSISQVRGNGARADPTMNELKQYFDMTYGSKVIYNNNSNMSQNSSDNSTFNLATITSDSTLIRHWDTDLQSQIDKTIRAVFESVRNVYTQEPIHPSGEVLHPNAGWSLNQPNVCPARAMFGVDIMFEMKPLVNNATTTTATPITTATTTSTSTTDSTQPTHSIQPVVLEVQWAPDCDQAVKQRPHFWDEILAALYLDDLSVVKPI